MRFLPALLLLTLSCHSQRYGFLEGPPRLRCQADSYFAQVNQEWRWSCTVAGDLAPYKDMPIGVEIITAQREEWPQRSLGEGLKRAYNFRTVFDREYYYDLMGKPRFRPGDRVELIDPNDPSAPLPPIEGPEATMDGSFWLELRLYPIEMWNQATGEVEVGGRIAAGRVRGRLQCHQCEV